MSEDRVERRLAAVLATNVAGYSRLVGADEAGTLAALKAIRRKVVDPKIKEHRGQIVKTTGDGALVEFTSVIDAVRCMAAGESGLGGAAVGAVLGAFRAAASTPPAPQPVQDKP